MRIFRLNRNDPIEIGCVVKARMTIPAKKILGEVVNIMPGNRPRVELILYDKRLKPMYSRDGVTLKRVTVDLSTCKLIDENFLLDTSGTFELGDIVLYRNNLRERYGVIVGFNNPDGLLTTSYEHGYNGVDLIECVEINKRGLTRKRNIAGNIKRFSAVGNHLKKCTVDLWNRTGPKITTVK